jgi:hypothetical protein
MSIEDKFWSKEQLKAIHKPRGKNVTHIRITAPGGKTAIVDWADKDTLHGVCGKIDVGRQRKKEKGPGFRFAKVAEIVKPAVEETTTPPTDLGTAGARTPAPVKKPAAPKSVTIKGPSKCAFIDNLLEEGGMTLDQILGKVMKKFPDSDPEKTMKTIRCRPCHMRKVGRVASWNK